MRFGDQLGMYGTRRVVLGEKETKMVKTKTPAAYSRQFDKHGLRVPLRLGNRYVALLCMPSSVE